MPRRPLVPTRGRKRQLLLSLPSEVADDLHCFCEAHFGVAHTNVICVAIREFIARELQRDVIASERFASEKKLLDSRGSDEALKLVPKKLANGIS